MDANELREILEKHKRWLKFLEDGEYANLYCANLHGAILNDADLRCANLQGADLSGAILSNANLRRVNLCNADLRNVDLCNADLNGANLYGANLHGANLHKANLCGTKNVSNAKNVPFIPMACPDSGSFTAWKKAHDYIVKLFIPEDARRSSSTGRKCRCDKAIVSAIETLYGEPTKLKEIASDYNINFIYRVGETVVEPDFCEDRFRECAKGIHFFINRQEAVDY